MDKTKNFVQTIREMEEYKKNPSLTPKKLVQEMLCTLSDDLQAYGLACVGGEAYIIHAYNNTIKKDVAIKIPFMYFNESERTIIQREKEYKVLAYNPASQRFLSGTEIQRAVFRTALKEGIQYFTVPEVYTVKQNPLYLEMEWVYSIQVLRWFSENPNIEAKIHAFSNVLRAAKFLHERGIVHRDLAPDNILIGPYNTVCILDWSMAKEIGDRNLTVKGVGMGKTPFASVIQATDARATTPIDEVHYLGWTFASFILNKNIPIPYDQGETNYRRTLAKMREEVVKHEKFHTIFTPIFKRATSLDEEDRYQTVDEFLEEIEDLQYQLKNTQEGRSIITLPATKYPKYKLDEQEQTIIINKPANVDIPSIIEDIAKKICTECYEKNHCQDCTNCMKINVSLTKIIVETVLKLKEKGII